MSKMYQSGKDIQIIINQQYTKYKKYFNINIALKY